ncbi:MAG: DUF2934 domain-containing protein [Candidatus Omnitrophica bacterium]|nr:DUF2934 domain-containing protein [Candidatus Omnitrophota bacterium]
MMFKSKMNKPESMRASISKTMTKDQLNAEIKKKAQELYEKRGRRPGNDLENWLEAERIVKASLSADLKRA